MPTGVKGLQRKNPMQQKNEKDEDGGKGRQKNLDYDLEIEKNRIQLVRNGWQRRLIKHLRGKFCKREDPRIKVTR